MSLGLAATPAVALYSAASPAHAASGDGSLTVQVIRDMGANGTYDAIIDLPLSGVTVKVTDKSGNSVSLTTGPDGKAVLPANDTRLTGGQYRVDVANPDSAYYKPAFANTDPAKTTPSATELSSNQEFVDLSGSKDVTVTTGFWHPRDYCQSNPKVANACQPGMFAHDGLGADADTAARDTVFTTNYNSGGYDDLAKSAAGSPDVGAGSVGTGSVYGIAYDRVRKQVFSAAYAKRNVDYGPLGPGGIYVTDPATKVTREFATVPNAGTTAHNTDGIAKGGNEDADFRKVVGKESLGAIVMSDDYKKLFVVNENDKKVYVYDVTDTSGSATALASFAIPDTSCATASDWRPMGLGEADGTLYVGGVCSGESDATQATPNPASMRAVVMTFDEDTYASKGVVLDDPLNFTRGGDGYGCMGDAGWYGWNDNLWCGSNGAQVNVPTPMLGKIVVEPNGDLDLAFRDRTGDQFGVNLQAFTVAAPATPIAIYLQAGGDLNLACKDNSGKFVMDSNGGCGVAAVAPGSDVNRFYTTKAPGLHPNASFAGMTRSRAEIGLITDEMDGAGAINSQALNVKNRDTGADAAFQQIGAASGLGTNFGKGQGLADMDVLCDLAPIQIGNRVWYNTAADGQQNAGEKPVVGATVNLYDKTGHLIATTTTNANGEYYFDSLKDGLTTDTDYVVKMDNPADYAAGGPLEGWKLSRTTTGPDGNPAAVGSDGYPAINVKTGAPGEDNHDLDFGFNPVPKIHVVKFDGRLTGPTNPDGTLGHDNNVKDPTVYQAGSNGYTGDQPVKMVVTNTGTAQLRDVVVSDQTLSKPKMTALSCDFSALGGPSSGTTWSGPFLPGDSFPCTGKVNLLAGQTHGDQINVVGTQLDPNTGKAVKDAKGNPVKVGDADRYYAKTGYQAKIVIDKRDKKTGTEADTKGKAMKFKRGETRTIFMPATNVGTAPVHNVVISDRTVRGATVHAFSCTFPGGKRINANRKGEVRWPASFGKNPKLWMPGVTIPCRAKLTIKSGGVLHGDVVKVTGRAPNGKKLHDSNPFWAAVSRGLPGAPNTGARSIG